MVLILREFVTKTLYSVILIWGNLNSQWLKAVYVIQLNLLKQTTLLSFQSGLKEAESLIHFWQGVKGLPHRDLKPSPCCVSAQDGVWFPFTQGRLRLGELIYVRNTLKRFALLSVVLRRKGCIRCSLGLKPRRILLSRQSRTRSIPQIFPPIENNRAVSNIICTLTPLNVPGGYI